MTKSTNHIVIKIAETDNVAVIANSEGLPEGTIINDDIRLLQNIPMGHKVALLNIGLGEKIIRYGQVIGFANRPIKAGEWVEESKMLLPEPPDLNSIPMPDNKTLSELKPIEGYTFLGYRNSDGSVGTKNILGITTSVQCVAGLAQYIVKKIKQKLLPKYPNVDDVVALNHSYGCGIAINVPSAIIPIRTLQNITTNPNFGGEVLVIGLGCEKLPPESLLLQNGNSKTNSDKKFSNVFYMQDESFYGFSGIVEAGLKMTEIHLKELNKRKREICPAADLVVGMQCGGSDAFSGITSNPAAGYAADLIVKAGGSVMFSEVTEVRDAVHLLVPRTINPEVGKALLDEMKWYDNYLEQGQADRSANPTPGNKLGGLSNIVEKALGSIVKSGTSPIVDVLGPGEKIHRKGLIFAATPASDFICGTLQLAAGMNMHVFMTGRGTPYGLSMVPVIKVGSNSKLSKRWFDLIDLDAGKIATGEKSIEEMGWELFHLILDVASGKKEVACDKLGLHNDLVLFNPGPVT
ncbi:MAG: galactarate dehydratase [Prolixibacteraceae bacterium]|jgi:galactarate dehydratase|nr:galactarate dehydratase [Prolixibacteraceae bacterium]MBT6998085.1 galactarate dehydratase [Prolixibacteraceae bacterium]